MKKALCNILPLFLLLIISSQKLYAAEASTEIKIVADIQKSGYVEEVFTYEVTLMSTTPNISNVRVIENPNMPAGLKIIQGVTQNSRPKKITEKGKTYYCWTIMRNFIISSKAGKYTIGAGKFIAFIPHETIVYHDFWGPRRSYEYEEVKIDCKAVSFKASDLPEKRPEEFSGCVGQFNIEAYFPPGKIYEGKEAYAVFTINGFGSLQDLKLPNIYKIFNKGCQLKEVEQNDEQMQRDGKLYSQVTLTCRFVALEEDFEIDSLSLNFFNPDTKKYYKAASEKLQWTSQPAKKSTITPKDAISI